MIWTPLLTNVTYHLPGQEEGLLSYFARRNGSTTQPRSSCPTVTVTRLPSGDFCSAPKVPPHALLLPRPSIHTFFFFLEATEL